VPERIERFCKTTRWFHWSFVAAFLTLAASGGALALRDELDLGEEGSTRLIRLHESAALALLVVPAVVLLSGRTGETLRDFAQALRWSRADLRWLALQPLAFLGRAQLPPAGKLNAGQKANAIATALLTAGLAASGTWLWARPGALLPWFAHLALFLAWIPAFLGHFFLAVVYPDTRPALRGMLLGQVDRAWAEHHHGAWVAERGGETRDGEPRDAVSPHAVRAPLAAIEATAADGGR
jgi:cytochrome b subunit of formate dehydrogenase